MSHEIRIERVQADKCPCGKGSIDSYQVIGKNTLSPRRYEKSAAEALAAAWGEIEELRSKLSASEAQRDEEVRCRRDCREQEEFQKVRADRNERTRRDEFAAAALTGILACFSDHKNATTGETRVEKAFEYADLMMRARAK